MKRFFILLLLIATPAQALDAGSASFDAELLRLSEILGALQYLRPLCGGGEGEKWRSDMQSFLESDASIGERRDRIVASFNRGYRGFETSYRACTPAAQTIIRLYLEEGAKISRDLVSRFGTN